MKKRRLKKIVKSHLNRIQDDGKALYNDGMDEYTIDKAAQIAAEASLGLLSDADLATALGITNPGNPLTEVLNIDKDAQPDNADAFPRDQREVADADNDGVGNNREIVDLHIKLLALAADDAIAQAAQDAAAAQVVIIDAQLLELQDHEDEAGNEDLGEYNTALGKFNTAVSTLETIRTNAAAKHAEAVAAEAAIAALPEPEPGIKYKIANTEYVAKDCFDNRAATLQAVADELAAVDLAADFANDRVADAQRTAAAGTTVPQE